MIGLLLLVLLPIELTAGEGEWSKPVVVRNGFEPAVRFQARLEGDYIIVRAIHEPDWHTYAMDNARRADEALQGKKSLGIEQGIEIKVERGLELKDRWLQTVPDDFSKPELRWYTYGFERVALFARRVKKVTDDQAVLHIRGQACRGETCCRIDVTLKLPTAIQADDSKQGGADRIQSMLKGLVPVKALAKEEEDAVR